MTPGTVPPPRGIAIGSTWATKEGNRSHHPDPDGWLRYVVLRLDIYDAGPNGPGRGIVRLARVMPSGRVRLGQRRSADAQAFLTAQLAARYVGVPLRRDFLACDPGSVSPRDVSRYERVMEPPERAEGARRAHELTQRRDDSYAQLGWQTDPHPRPPVRVRTLRDYIRRFRGRILVIRDTAREQREGTRTQADTDEATAALVFHVWELPITTAPDDLALLRRVIRATEHEPIAPGTPDAADGSDHFTAGAPAAQGTKRDEAIRDAVREEARAWLARVEQGGT